jgi:4-hydroxythreonine-4-phosphate dehydrogenase
MDLRTADGPTKRVALTVGDPAGIGPEIVLRALASPARPYARYVVYGPRAAVDERAGRFGLRPLAALDVGVEDVALEAPVAWGRTSAAGGAAAAQAVLRAARDAMAGRVDALVTAPLNKESLRAAGHPWPGHTELLAEAAGVPDVVMMFVGGSLRVALLTIHRSLRSVPDALTVDGVLRVGRLVAREMGRYGGVGPVAFCGLNPHAGEAGLFGDEEQLVLSPAIAALRAEGIDARGPFPADSVFVKASQGAFGAVIACYHDQGLIPVKLASFGHAVNVTLGLPFVRTSVDHGTGFDIVEKGVAEEGSLLAAMRLAVDVR